MFKCKFSSRLIQRTPSIEAESQIMSHYNSDSQQGVLYRREYYSQKYQL